MKKIFTYLREYLKNFWHFRLYAASALFLAVAIFVEYQFDFRRNYIEHYDNLFIQWLVVFLFYAVPYLLVCALVYLFDIRRSFFKIPSFWIKFAVGFLILSFDQSYIPNVLIRGGLKDSAPYFYVTVFSWLTSLLFIVIPLIIFNIIIENIKGRNLYGLLIRKFDVKPYVLLLIISATFLFAGSFLQDVNSYYPRYLHSGGSNFAAINGLSEWVTVSMYEFSYGLSFISVEHFFRGFLVLGFVRYMRGYTIIPMVVCYCLLHFGKPIGETITSIFGGYILGIFVYKTRNIWGGIILHIGIALLMELFSYWNQ